MKHFTTHFILDDWQSSECASDCFRILPYPIFFYSLFNPVDARHRFNVYETSIKRRWRRIVVLWTSKRRRVSSGKHLFLFSEKVHVTCQVHVYNYYHSSFRIFLVDFPVNLSKSQLTQCLILINVWNRN